MLGVICQPKKEKEREGKKGLIFLHNSVLLDLTIVREILVVAVRNFSGYIQVDKEGNWTCISDKKHKAETHPDPVNNFFGSLNILLYSLWLELSLLYYF